MFAPANLRWPRALIAAGLMAVLGACASEGVKELPAASSSSSVPTTASSATAFADPQGTYSMEIAPEWVSQHGVIKAEVEAWEVAAASDQFVPNLNVLTQKSANADLATYLDTTVEQGNALIEDFKVLERKIVKGNSDNELGVLEFTGTQRQRRLHFLVVIALRSGNAIVATLTSPEPRFAEVRAKVEPYMLTLRAT